MTQLHPPPLPATAGVRNSRWAVLTVLGVLAVGIAMGFLEPRAGTGVNATNVELDAALGRAARTLFMTALSVTIARSGGFRLRSFGGVLMALEWVDLQDHGLALSGLSLISAPFWVVALVAAQRGRPRVGAWALAICGVLSAGLLVYSVARVG